MSIVAIITARGGSKRIPRKNIKEFMGKPMLAYAVEAALGSGIFDEVMVSTDDNEIADVARNCGASVPFMRSAATANDFATTADVLKEVIASYRAQGRDFDELCCIYPCVPFLTASLLKDAHARYTSLDCDALTPVVRYSFPIQRAFRVDENGFLRYREPRYAAARSQDLEPTFHDVGMFYFKKTSTLDRPSSKTAYYEMDERHIQDIDTPEDWKMAEMKYRMLHHV